MNNSQKDMDRKHEIFTQIMKLRSLQIINLERSVVKEWVETIDENLSDKTTIKDIEEFCNSFVIGERQWDKFKGVSNILVFPLRDYTEKEIQARRVKLGID